MLSVAQIPTGAYALPELCLKLRAATGIAHTVDGDLKDYPVFVATKTGDPERVKALVAAAMRAEWRKDGDRIRLTLVKPDLTAEFAKFEKQFKAAAAKSPIHSQLRARDLYDMAPGQMIRYSYPQVRFSKPLPAALLKTVMAAGDKTGFVTVRRQMEGDFECRYRVGEQVAGAFSVGAELQFESLPVEVTTLLGSDLNKAAVTSQEQAAIQAMVSSPDSLKVDWSDISKRDPVAVIADTVLPKVAAAIKPELAVALPDLSLFALGRLGQGPRTVRAGLEPFVTIIDWNVVDGALIGKLPMCDRVSSGQVKRDVLSRFLGTVKASGIANVDALGQYVHDQRRAASDSWADAMLLVLAGVVVDQEFIGDYPFNVRLYTNLSQADWGIVKSGKPFGIGQLSPSARDSLMELLLQARTRLQTESEDPVYWPGFDSGNFGIRAEVTEESILIGRTGVAAEVSSVSHSAGNYEMRKKSLGREPLYQPGLRQKLKLTISPIQGDSFAPVSVETGFTEVRADSKVRPVQWDQLPKAIADEFRKALESRRAAIEQGIPPPPPRRTTR